MWSASSSAVTSTSAERALALPDQVEQPARGGDEQVDAAAQRGDLPAHRARRRRRRAPARRSAGRAGRARPAPARPARGSGPAPARAGRRRRRPVPPASRASIGSPKASVLPEPVSARPSRSRPASASGRVAGLDRERRADAAPLQTGEQRLRQPQGGEVGRPGRGVEGRGQRLLELADRGRSGLATRRRRAGAVTPLAAAGAGRCGAGCGETGRGRRVLSRTRAAGRAGQAENSRWVGAAPGRCSAGRPGGRLARRARRC